MTLVFLFLSLVIVISTAGFFYFIWLATSRRQWSFILIAFISAAFAVVSFWIAQIASEKYLKNYPSGTYFKEAREKIIRQPIELTEKRRNLLESYLEYGKGDSLGGLILSYFAPIPQSENATINLLFQATDDWPAKYENFFDKTAKETIEAFGKLIGADVKVLKSNQNPPYSHVTLIFQYSAELYKRYQLKRKLLAPTIDGIAVDSSISLYLPKQDSAKKNIELKIIPPDEMHFLLHSGEFITSKSSMRKDLILNLEGQLCAKIREELGMDSESCLP